MVYGLWFMVYGLWFMVYGLWFMVYGLWFMVYGLWFMVYGLWFMVYGLWFMVYGLWLHRPAAAVFVQHPGGERADVAHLPRPHPRQLHPRGVPPVSSGMSTGMDRPLLPGLVLRRKHRKVAARPAHVDHLTASA
jgi:hypothetical protein